MAGVYLDISKAFDTVNHKILLNKLQNCGVEGSFLAWFGSYLSGRKQVVKLKNFMSREIQIMRGVPQSGMLGPLLFLIYIDNIFSLPLHGSMYVFADDSAVVFKAPDDESLTRMIQSNLDVMQNWFQDNKLIVNSSKTKIVHYKFKNDNSTLGPFSIHSDHSTGICKCPKIEISDNIKYLGVILDNTLTWGPHLDYLQKK